MSLEGGREGREGRGGGGEGRGGGGEGRGGEGREGRGVPLVILAIFFLTFLLRDIRLRHLTIAGT